MEILRGFFLGELLLYIIRKLINKKCIIIVFGDFNLDVTHGGTKVLRFLNLIRKFNLYCTNWESTRGNSVLGNILKFSDEDSSLFKTCVLNMAVHGLKSDHQAILCKFGGQAGIV